jgi:plastocyanin
MKRFAQVLGIAALAIAAAACSGGGAPATGAPSQPAPSTPAGEAIVIVAKDLKFDTTSVSAPAGVAFEIILDNQESAPHNIAIKDAAGETVFKGEIVAGKQVTNAVPALAAGRYTFWCEVHPEMQGTLDAS